MIGRDRSITAVEEAVATVPGVSLEEGQIIVRGGRPVEVKLYADGMPIKDDFVGNTALTLSLVSLSDIEVLTGGFDAEYGNVQSGIINLRTKEGGAEYQGVVRFMTDDYGACITISKQEMDDEIERQSREFWGDGYEEWTDYFPSGEIVEPMAP